MKAGIIGLPSTGKSTLFSLLTGAPAPLPGGRPEPRVGIARVPDPRVDALAEMYRPRKKTPATVEYVDMPGVAKGEGAALVDLPALRGVDALVHVVRAFPSDVVPHPEGSIDPLRDARMLELELILADLGTVERRLARLDANIKKANRAEDVAERAVFLKLKDFLESERPLRLLELSEDERRKLRGYALLSGKPLLLVINMSEDQVRRAGEVLEKTGLTAFAAEGPGRAVCAVSAPIEAEMAQLGPEDAQAFRIYMKTCQVPTSFFFGAYEDATVEQVLRALDAQRRMSAFVLEQQKNRPSPEDLKKAFSSFLLDVRQAPTPRPGTI